MGKEQLAETTNWYKRLYNIASLRDSLQRFSKLSQLHDETLHSYIDLLNSITPTAAQQITSDGRTRAIVVAHIMGWEEWQTQVFKDPHPFVRLNQQLHYKGYQDRDTGAIIDFSNSNRHRSIDDFNAYQAKKYGEWTWEDIHERAIKTAVGFRNIFSQGLPSHWLNFLDNTPLKVWRMAPDMVVTVPAGWYLWMVSLKHEAIEHSCDLKP